MILTCSIPEWIRKDREKYWDPLVDDATGTSPDQHVVACVLDSLQWPVLDRPPDRFVSPTVSDRSVAWQWGLFDDPANDFWFNVYMRRDGKACLTLFAYDDKACCCNAVVGEWRSGHRFKYGWYSLQDVKRVWELFAAADANVDAIRKHCGTMDRLAVRAQ
jgi:hypothetical protein